MKTINISTALNRKHKQLKMGINKTEVRSNNQKQIKNVDHNNNKQNIDFVYLQIKEKKKNEKTNYICKAHLFNYIPIIFNIYNSFYTNNY